MASDGSVAPKERVNIKFKPATGDAKEEVELPLKMLMMGDFTGRPDERPVEERELIDINKDNFEDVLKGQNLSVDLRVDNKLEANEDQPTIDVKLDIKSMRDFEPERIARQVPELRKLLELREALVGLKGPLGNVPNFRKAIQGVMDDEGARQRLLDELTNSDKK
jgi:type VI secretion system protein ImpB